ncbi:MAG: efflux RND transporter periplasmic adaptor subunit [Ignavibacteriaceae bacterium]
MKKEIFIFLLLAAITILFNACGDAGGNIKEKEDEGGFTYIEVTEIKFKPFVHYIDLIGFAKAYYKADIASEEGGKIEKYLKAKGSYVKEGDVILELENEVLKANMNATKAQYDMAEINFKKQEDLYNQKVVSELQYLNSKYERDAAKANYELMKSRYDKTFIKAPFPGIFDGKNIEAGEYAAPGSPIVSMVNIDRIKVEAGVPENYVNDVKEGNKVKIVFNDLGGVSFDEKISFVGSSINTDNRTFPIEVVINNGNKKIKPELNALVKIEKANYNNVAVIPEEIVISTDKGNVVFVEKNGIAKMRVVKVLSRFNNHAAVSEGLNEGDNLVTVGYQNLVDGEKVKILE